MSDAEHVPVQINKYDAEGHRTHEVPGHVCGACTDWDADPTRLVPVSDCPVALAAYDAQQEAIVSDILVLQSAVQGTPDYRCPGCNEVSMLVIGPTQAVCTNEVSCMVLMFDPSLPDGGLSNAQVIEPPELS